MVKSGYKYLDNIDSPDDLRKLEIAELKELCGEIRDFMVAELAVNPGHMGSSLGTVELAVAIHYVFDTPDDKVVWDVGHQAYAHKILTGRRDIFHTNRKLGGISGFPAISESPYDSFGGGHSSVSISAAFGIAVAEKLLGKDNNVIAVIGDGAMTGGLAYEGLNNAGSSMADVLVILNDNNMSINPNVGAIKEYLLSITTSRRYNSFKNKVWNATSKVPRFRRSIQKLGNAVKHGILGQSNLFESLKFRYFGPVDGNDLKSLIRVLEDLKHISGPKLLHVLTVKGKGYAPAEKDQPGWHAPGKFNVKTGERHVSREASARYQDVFGHTLIRLAKEDRRIVGVTPAMLTGCSMDVFQTEMPERCFDVGIAEGHAVTFSAGLATQGMVPFCNIYSTFIQRAYDNVIHDVALQNLHVVFCLDRGGLVGEDGATHHGAFDLAFLRSIPNMVVSAPLNEAELKDMMFTALKAGKPFSIRYPRGNGPGSNWKDGDFKELEIGRGHILREGSDLALISIGAIGNEATIAVGKAASEGISVEHIDLRFVKPLDEELLRYAAGKFDKIITVEDGILKGGAGSAIIEFFADNGCKPIVRRLGIEDKFIEHGTVAELRHICGYDAEGILNSIRAIAVEK